MAAVEHWLPLMFEPEEQIVEIARMAEAAGFTGVCLADHVALPVGFTSRHPMGVPIEPGWHFWDPVTVAATVCAVTERLQVMTFALVVTMRDPFTVAKAAGTLSTLSGGRFQLGVATGWLVEEIALLGHDPRTRGRRMDEQLEIIRGFLHDGTVEHHGRHYDLGPTAMHPVPEVPPPILVGGRADAALARAARHDGWLGMEYPLADTWELLDRLDEHRSKLPEDQRRSDQPFRTVVVPTEELTDDLVARIGDRGVSAIVAAPWYPGDPQFASLDAKRAAMEQWSARYGLT